MPTVVDSLARAYARTPAGMRGLALRGPHRAVVLAQIFRAMDSQLDREKAKDIDAVVHWQVGRAPDRWQLVIADGRCRASRRLDRDPTLTIALDDAQFLQLVTGMAGGPALWTSGKLKLTGDLMLAARMSDLFRVPRPK